MSFVRALSSVGGFTVAILSKDSSVFSVEDIAFLVLNVYLRYAKVFTESVRCVVTTKTCCTNIL